MRLNKNYFYYHRELFGCIFWYFAGGVYCVVTGTYASYSYIWHFTTDRVGVPKPKRPKHRNALFQLSRKKREIISDFWCCPLWIAKWTGSCQVVMPYNKCFTVSLCVEIENCKISLKIISFRVNTNFLQMYLVFLI